MDQSRIRNFAIIAHIDHGKSTLSDRLLEVTRTVDPREMSEQLLDTMDLEREKGITIKARAVRMEYESPPSAGDAGDYEYNLIDTPGHVDFSYEVSRSLAAAEGALLVVDAAAGIQAQTLANVYLALEQNLTILPVVNKIDLPVARPEDVARELSDVIGFAADEVLFVSAKTGEGIPELLEAIRERIPAPSGKAAAPSGGAEIKPRALIFDSEYDSYKGVIAYVRVVDGSFDGSKPLRLLAGARRFEPIEVGHFVPGPKPTKLLEAGSVGYIATGLKDVGDVRVGETITTWQQPATELLPGYEEPKSMVFAGLYPTNSADYADLTDALEKLRLSDASIHFEAESSAALGFGYRMGFLGLLHMEIVQERLEREYGLELIFTAPSVAYELVTTSGETSIIDNPALLPDPTRIDEIREPWVEISVIAPNRYVGAIMEVVTTRRGRFRRQEYLERGEVEAQSDRLRVLLEYDIPLGEILTDFYDELKSRTQGYASLDYHLKGYEAANVVRLDILVNGDPVDALSMIVHREKSQVQGRQLVEKLRSLIPRQMFDVPIQAAIGGKIIARETVKALRKNVLSKCYGGDVSRKHKLLAKQAAGKKRLKRVGNVEIPQEAFMAVLDVTKPSS